MSEQPGVNVTVEDMYRLLSSIDKKVDGLLTGAEGMQERIADHEARLRVVERREDPALIKLIDRTAALEAQFAAMKEHDNLTTPERLSPSTIAALVISALAIVTTVILFVIHPTS